MDTARLQRVGDAAIGLSAVLPVAFVAALLALRWPEYWMWINFEDTPMTSLEVAVMYTCALVAAAAGAHAWMYRHARAREWAVLAMAFGYFALDDRFALHERLRDRVLAPRDIRLPWIDWIGPGDFIVLGFAVCGLLLLPRLLRNVFGDRAARRRMLAGVAVAMVAVGLDAFELSRLTVPMQRLEQTVEECLELAAQVLFLQAFALAWLAQLRALATSAGADRPLGNARVD